MTTPKRVSPYDVGDLVQLRATIIGTDGITPAQPSYFAFLVKNPLGSIATYATTDTTASVVNTGAGAFLKNVDVGTLAGSWFYRAMATGLVQSAEEWAFYVSPSFIF